MSDDGRVLWILGAGASKHLDLPLLAEFRPFMETVARHPSNQGRDDAADRCASLRTVQRLTEAGIDDDIERLLQKHIPSSTEHDDAVQAIRWCFEKRHHAVMHQRDTPYKYAAYAYFLCCVRDQDRIVNFNYDLAIERTFSNARRTDSEHAKQPRIPEPCLQTLKNRRIQLVGVQEGGSSGIELVKIHGSLSFSKGDQGAVAVGNRPNEAVDTPYLVYPTPNKATIQSGPAESLLNAATSGLDNFNRIVIVGYSFPHSDCDHPFVSKLSNAAAEKRIVVVSPKPVGELLDLANKAKRSVLWVDKFENVFSPDHVRNFGEVVGRKPDFK